MQPLHDLCQNKTRGARILRTGFRPHQCFHAQLPCSSISTQLPQRISPLVIFSLVALQTESLQPARLLGEISVRLRSAYRELVLTT